ncbi:hypothetical protein EZJ19_14080 [Parasulfuritortus cantonensis]|uniref:Uncharacterized protein n=1 Tax=Parasulfuritortus cantonensis TaxID=2528202 RepID=A0A4R1B1U8_9PROT|nr:hypothetical protein [Parasulfuritortus cantonensis]TCJ11781.1 hypothetical protein EZJ19_14080 [Parasulfuritortus cantonensis]
MKTAVLFILLAASGTALAGPEAGAADRKAACDRLMTEAECRQYRADLVSLTDPAARRLYLAEHEALLHERELMCGGLSGRQIVARAQYR